MRKVEGLSYYAAARNLTYERKMQSAATQWERAVAQGGNAVPLPDAYVRLIKNQIARNGDYKSTMSEALQRLPDNHFLEAANRALELFEGNRARGAWQLEQEPSHDPNMNSFLAGIFDDLGLRYARQGDSEPSIMACKQALRFEPHRATTLKLLAGQLVEVGRLTELEELSSAASGIETNDSEILVARADMSSDYTRLGIAFFDLGAVTKSNAAYEKALLLDETNTIARVNMGWGLYRTGDIPGAITQYQTVLVREKHSMAQFNLGLAYLAQGDLAAANATYAAAIAEYGTEEAERIGADNDLRELASRGKQAGHVLELLHRYWPKKP